MSKLFLGIGCHCDKLFIIKTIKINYNLKQESTVFKYNDLS